MRQTTPEQIRTLQTRSILSFDPPQGFRRGKSKDSRADTYNPQSADPRFRPASSGITELFSSQHFDVLRCETPTKSNNWAVWWSDLMMTMFIMFAALYAFQMPKDALPPKTIQIPMPLPEEPQQAEQPVSDSILDRTFESAREAVQQAGLEDQVGVRLVPEKTLRVSISGDLLFDGNKVALKPTASKSLHIVSEALKKAPYKVMVIGHTDNSPAVAAYASNWEVSTARACAVGRALILEGGIAEDRLIMVGLGDQQPLQANDSPANMALNRRVELVLSVENPTDVLADEKMASASKDNVRHWLVKSAEGKGDKKWNEKH